MATTFHDEGLAAVRFPPKWSPWGSVQNSRKLAEGIWVVDTAGHGGIWLSPERRKQVPQYVTDVTFLKSRTWFEEDCDQAWPRVIFRAELNPIDAKQAEDWLRSYKPEALARLLADMAKVTP